MLNFFLKIKTVNTCFKGLKISSKTVLYLYFYILKKNSISFVFKNSSNSKSFVIIQSPFHYKNSKKKVHNVTKNSTIIFSLKSTLIKRQLFFLKKFFFLNPFFFKIKKIKVRSGH